MPDLSTPTRAAAAAPPSGSSSRRRRRPAAPRRLWLFLSQDAAGPVRAGRRQRQPTAMRRDAGRRRSGRSGRERRARAINSVLPSVSCTWLDIGTRRGRRERASASRCAASPATATSRDRQDPKRARPGRARRIPTVNFDDVAPITQAGCSALDTFRQIRARAGGHLTTAAAALRNGDAGRRRLCRPRGGDRAGSISTSATPAAISPCSASSRRARSPLLLPNRAMFEQVLAGSRGGRPISRDGNGRYRVHIDADHRAGRACC